MEYKPGPRLKAARKALSLTHKQLGEKLGMSARTVMRREQGAAVTTAEELRAWALVTGADPAWLLDMGGSPPVMQVQP